MNSRIELDGEFHRCEAAVFDIRFRRVVVCGRVVENPAFFGFGDVEKCVEADNVRGLAGLEVQFDLLVNSGSGHGGEVCGVIAWNGDAARFQMPHDPVQALG